MKIRIEGNLLIILFPFPLQWNGHPGWKYAVRKLGWLRAILAGGIVREVAANPAPALRDSTYIDTQTGDRFYGG